MATSLGSLLIVDDETAHLEALSNTLSERGYSTARASSGVEAVGQLHSGAFDLLLTDLKMPDMDGIALLREALAIDPRLVGILMTGHGTIATAVEAMQVGALDYILKPFKLSAVLPVLARALAVRRLRLDNAELEGRIRERSAELEAVNNELDAFAYSISHDLRAPLRAVSALADIFVKEHGPSLSLRANELVEHIRSAGQHGEQLVEGLLRFSRLGRQPLSKTPVRLMALIQEVLEEVRSQEPLRQVDLHIDALPDLVLADEALLRQVFANLLSNAFKFTRGRDSASIDLGCEELKGERVFFVRDNGVGFDMQEATGLFGVFQRLHTQKQFAGTGVGLSLVQRIVQRHGGRIWAEAAVDQGATFYFTLEASRAVRQ